jgi:RNA polymerase sigma-70 factor, ECF subfamily
MPHTDKELLEMLKNEDAFALQQIFNAYHHALCSVAYRLVRDKDQAKDIVQDVFIKFWKNRQAFVLTGSLHSYLKKATVNTSLNILKSKAHLSKVDLDLAANIPSNHLEEQVYYKELVEKTNKAIAGLPERTRLVFTLVRSEELSYLEVAESLEISTKAVEKEMMRALRLLREQLKDHLSSLLILMMLSQFP